MRRPPLPKHRKVRGELAETRFVSEAIQRGFRVCKPYGDSAPFDFVIEKHGRLLRIQVKSTAHAQRGGRYFQLQTAGHWRAHRTSRIYRPSQVDFLVGYVFPCDAWYIIPTSRVHVTAIHLRPGKGKGQFERYRDAWHLLEPPLARSSTCDR